MTSTTQNNAVAIKPTAFSTASLPSLFFVALGEARRGALTDMLPLFGVVAFDDSVDCRWIVCVVAYSTVLLFPAGRLPWGASVLVISGTSAEWASETAARALSLGLAAVLTEPASFCPLLAAPGLPAWEAPLIPPGASEPISLVAEPAGADAGAAPPGAALASMDAMLDDISSICEVQGTVTSVVDGAFSLPQLHVLIVVVIGTLGGGTGLVLPM